MEKLNNPKVKFVSLKRFNQYYGINIKFEHEFHELFEELEKTDLHCGYIAHNWEQIEYARLVVEAVVNIEDRLYFAVRNLDIMDIDFSKVNLNHEV